MKKLFFALCCVLLAAAQAVAAPSVTTGMGYKKMLTELCALYKADTGKEMVEVYSGNIGQALAQFKAGSGVSIFISDKESLEKSGVPFVRYEPLGTAVLVLAWRKGVTLTSPQDLAKADIKHVGYPDSKGAIYGKAADRFLTESGLKDSIADKLRMLSTVPQVFSYLSSGELDAGFINTAVAKAQGKALGGSMDISTGYTPIVMTAAVVQGAENDPDVQHFITFLTSDKARALCARHGVLR